MMVLDEARGVLDAARPEHVSLVRTAAATIVIIAAPTTSPDDLVVIDDAAKVARVSRRTLRESIRAGEVAASGRGRAIVIRRRDLDAWIASRAVRRSTHHDAELEREVDARIVAESDT